MRSDPELYQRDCKHCFQYCYQTEGPDKGKPFMRLGKPLERYGSPPPCLTRTGCPKGTIDRQHVLTPTNAKVLTHYRECRAVNDFPDDPHVRKNAAIINEVERMLDRKETSEAIQMVALRSAK